MPPFSSTARERVVTHDHAAIHVAISPNGERLVVAKGTGPLDDEIVGIEPIGLFIHELAGSGEQRLTAGGTHPGWSPDGSEIAFISGRSVRVINVDGTHEREIFRISRGDIDRTYLVDVAWSGDSQRVAFATGPLERGNSAVWSVREDGSDLRKHFAIDEDIISGLTWSPDGEHFAWGGSFRGVRSVMLAGSSGKPTQVEPNSEDPMWSADGSELAYVIGHEGHYRPRIVVGDEVGAGEEAVSLPQDARGGTSLEDWASC